jgi:hypothetical protein
LISRTEKNFLVAEFSGATAMLAAEATAKDRDRRHTFFDAAQDRLERPAPHRRQAKDAFAAPPDVIVAKRGFEQWG